MLTPAEARRRISRRGRRLHLDLAGALIDQLATYLDLLWTWNRKINLTALERPDEAIDRLLLEPLLAARQLPPGPIRLVDIGSGGGSPAIPLRLARPDVALTMVEAKTRKAAFLREAVRRLGLTGTQVETQRYEELLTRPEMVESADVVSVRAVRLDPKALLKVQAFARPGGALFLFVTAGAQSPDIVPPPLAWAGEVALIDDLRSALVVLRKVA